MKRLQQLFRNNDRGDTIVEVLISVAIISLVLVSGYSLSNRSTNTVQDSREHQQALSIANSQVEFLRRNIGLDTDNNDCFDDAGNNTAASPFLDGCSYTPAGQSGCAIDDSGFCYTVRVTQVASTQDTSHTVSPISVTYKIDVKWDSILGGTSDVTLYYRVSQTDPDYVFVTLPGQPVPVLPPGAGGGEDGPPAIGSGSCKKNSTLPQCQKPTGPPRYHYTQSFVNQTVKIPAAQIKSCVWTFGDGTTGGGSASSPSSACLFGQEISHNYENAVAARGGVQAYPKSCTKPYMFQVTMVITKTDGSKASAVPYPTKMPKCY